VCGRRRDGTRVVGAHAFLFVEAEPPNPAWEVPGPRWMEPLGGRRFESPVVVAGDRGLFVLISSDHSCSRCSFLRKVAFSVMLLFAYPPKVASAFAGAPWLVVCPPRLWFVSGPTVPLRRCAAGTTTARGVRGWRESNGARSSRSGAMGSARGPVRSSLGEAGGPAADTTPKSGTGRRDIFRNSRRNGQIHVCLSRGESDRCFPQAASGFAPALGLKFGRIG